MKQLLIDNRVEIIKFILTFAYMTDNVEHEVVVDDDTLEVFDKFTFSGMMKEEKTVVYFDSDDCNDLEIASEIMLDVDAIIKICDKGIIIVPIKRILKYSEYNVNDVIDLDGMHRGMVTFYPIEERAAKEFDEERLKNNKLP